MVSVFRKEFTITSYELTPREKARLTTVVNYFQEVAYYHTHEPGNHLLIIGIDAIPGANGDEDSHTLLATREEDGQELIRARISWV